MMKISVKLLLTLFIVSGLIVATCGVSQAGVWETVKEQWQKAQDWLKEQGAKLVNKAAGVDTSTSGKVGPLTPTGGHVPKIEPGRLPDSTEFITPPDIPGYKTPPSQEKSDAGEPGPAAPNIAGPRDIPRPTTGAETGARPPKPELERLKGVESWLEDWGPGKSTGAPPIRRTSDQMLDQMRSVSPPRPAVESPSTEGGGSPSLDLEDIKSKLKKNNKFIDRRDRRGIRERGGPSAGPSSPSGGGGGGPDDGC